MVIRFLDIVDCGSGFFIELLDFEVDISNYLDMSDVNDVENNIVGENSINDRKRVRSIGGDDRVS